MRDVRVVGTLVAVLTAASAGAAGRQLPMVDFVQEVWDAREGGLPHPAVTALQQTRDGYLWVGTFTGLSRFDGHQFTRPYRGTSALREHIRALHETADGSLWVGTRRSGALMLRDGRVQRTLTTADGLRLNDVTSIASTPDGTVWLAAGGLLAIGPDGKTRNYGEADGVPAGTLYALSVDPDGTLWVGASGYAVAWRDGTRFRPVSWTSLPEGAGRIWALRRDAAGALWIATGNGVFRASGERTEAASLERRVEGSALCLLAGRQLLWTGGERGLATIAGNDTRPYADSDGLLHNVVQAIHEDNEGSVWIGTRTGLARLRPRLIHTYTTKDGLPSEHVTAVFETAAHELWVGTENGLARRRDGRWTSFGIADGLPSTAIRSLVEDQDGTLWVGTLNGLARYRRGRFDTFPVDGTGTMIRSLAVGDAGRLWIGAFGRGLYQFEHGAVVQRATRADLCHTGPIVLVPASDGGVWMGGAQAFVHFKDGRSRCDVDREFVPRNDVRHVLVDGRTLWLATIGGLARVDPSGRRSLAWRGGPLESAVYSILDDGQGSFWLGTPKGLFQVAREELESDRDTVAYRPFNIEDGMATGVCTGDGQPSAWKGHDGRLYFTTANGLVVVDPRRVEKTTVPPPVHIERLIADQKPVALDGNIRLAPGTRDVQIDFVALSFVAPDGVDYRYQLEGYDRDWIEAGSRRAAYYTNLPPGSYRFRVRAANQDGVWNTEGAQLHFTLAPRVYQRGWFGPLVIALCLGAGVSFYRLRVAALRARQAELQQHVDEAVANIKVLRGLLPICASCKKVRDDSGYWSQIESYLGAHTEAGFSHSVCPECLLRLYPDYAKAILSRDGG